MMTGATHFVLLLVLQCFHYGTQVATYDVHLSDLYKMQTGIGWPHALHVFVGHEALLKLASSLENIETCEVTTPEGIEFNVRQPPNDRYEAWGDGCSVRVKNVVLADRGRWRLTAARGDQSITGWTEVHVEENINQYTGPPIVLHDGETHAEVELSTLSNSYCLVAQPFSDSSLVPGHCRVTLDRTTRAVQGNWHVLLGLPGRVSELQVDRSVAVESERLDVGFLQETSPNKLHLYCNIQHSVKNITFCRFQKTTDRAGFNVIDGLSDGTHSYYGEGFSKRQCGMTIESPSAVDYATWRCTVGVQEWEGTTLRQRTPLQALIRVVNTGTRSVRLNRTPRDGERTIFVQKDMSFSISCQADASLRYCWFQHPNGSQFTPTAKTSDDQLFWYSGESLETGNCDITFNHTSYNDTGLWICHMGPRDFVGLEYTDQVEVNVAGPLTAREKEVAAYIGGNATLYCHTSNGNRPLDYCRFLTPSFVGISVDTTVTAYNAIANRFFFTPGRDLDYGDCSLTISPVLAEDVGTWTCAGLVDEEVLESSDTIRVFIGEAGSTFRAGVIGMSVGAAVLTLTLVGALSYKYRGSIATVRWRRTNNTGRTSIGNASDMQRNSDAIMEMRELELERSSLGSGSSVTASSTRQA